VGVCKFQEIQNLVKTFTIPFDETPIASVPIDSSGHQRALLGDILITESCYKNHAHHRIRRRI